MGEEERKGLLTGILEFDDQGAFLKKLSESIESGEHRKSLDSMYVLDSANTAEEKLAVLKDALRYKYRDGPISTHVTIKGDDGDLHSRPSTPEEEVVILEWDWAYDHSQNIK